MDLQNVVCGARCDQDLGHALQSQTQAVACQSPGNNSRRLLSVQSCLFCQQCGHRCLVRVSSGLLSFGCGSGNMTCGGVYHEGPASPTLPSTAGSPLSAPILLLLSVMQSCISFVTILAREDVRDALE